MMKLIFIFISAALVNNFVLTYFLGICPFLGVSRKLNSAVGMGVAVTFVMTISALTTWVLYHKILAPFGLEYLEYAVFILVIASLVQIVEMVVRKISLSLYQALGIYLPLITTNCAILGLTLFMVLKEYNFIQSIFFALGAGVGFTLALLIMAGIREDLEFADLPQPLKGAGIALIIAGLLALSFMGFSGLLSV